MACTTECRKPTPAQAHCTVCHETFGGVTMFDRHRVGGRCLPPDQCRMVDRDGVWREQLTAAQKASLDRLQRTKAA